jgi:hypothetical protein
MAVVEGGSWWFLPKLVKAAKGHFVDGLSTELRLRRGIDGRGELKLDEKTKISTTKQPSSGRKLGLILKVQWRFGRRLKASCYPSPQI